MNQFKVYIYHFPFESPSQPHAHPTPPGHHRAQSWAPCAIQQLLTSHLLYTRQCVSVNPTLNSSHRSYPRVSWGCLFVQLSPVLFCVLRALAMLFCWTSSFISAHCVCWALTEFLLPCAEAWKLSQGRKVGQLQGSFEPETRLFASLPNILYFHGIFQVSCAFSDALCFENHCFIVCLLLISVVKANPITVTSICLEVETSFLGP